MKRELEKAGFLVTRIEQEGTNFVIKSAKQPATIKETSSMMLPEMNSLPHMINKSVSGKINTMNILVSSTRQWNPGDEFILMGVRNLFEEALGPVGINWVLYDRNPDLFVDGFSTHQRKETIWGNSYHHDSPECFNLALVAGTPEWMGRPLEGFYSTVRRGRLPLYIIGAGYIDAPIVFSEDEMYCLKNTLKLAITRDEYASRALNEIGVQHEILPCPALFASTWESVPHVVKKIGFIIQTNKTVNQKVTEELSYACAHTVNQLRKKGFEVDVVCHYIDEFVEFTKVLSPVRYSYDSLDYIDMIGSYDLVLSTRLHGAILANSMGKPAIMLNNDDSRCTGAAMLFPFIYVSTPENIINDVIAFDPKNAEQLVQWKAGIKDRYLSLLREAISHGIE